MKWVEIRTGNYKLVGDEDPRPAVELPKKPFGTPSVKFNPSWKKYEQYLHNPEVDAKTNEWATDMFLAERKHALETDSQARRWENSRKETVRKEKPTWKKQQDL